MIIWGMFLKLLQKFRSYTFVYSSRLRKQKIMALLPNLKCMYTYETSNKYKGKNNKLLGTNLTLNEFCQFLRLVYAYFSCIVVYIKFLDILHPSYNTQRWAMMSKDECKFTTCNFCQNTGSWLNFVAGTLNQFFKEEFA